MFHNLKNILFVGLSIAFVSTGWAYDHSEAPEMPKVMPKAYFQIGGGISALKDFKEEDNDGSFSAPMGGDNGGLFSLGFGVYSSSMLRGEIEASFASYKTTDDIGIGYPLNLSMASFSMNALIDVYNPSGKVAPYLGIGVGVTSISGDNNTSESEKTSAFHFQGIVGINVAVASRTDLYVEYTYRRLEDAEFKNITLTDLTTQSGEIGIRFLF